MRQPLLAGLLMASSCWGYQQAAGNVMRGLPEETAADLTGTSCGNIDDYIKMTCIGDVKLCASMHSCSVVGRVLQ